MAELLLAVISWLGFLQRPDVLKQLLAIGLALLLGRWLARARWRDCPGLFRWIHRQPPIPLIEEGALLLTIPLLSMAGQESGLVLLVAQIKAAWLSLNLLEHQLLDRWLDREMRLRLSSRLLRPALPRRRDGELMGPQQVWLRLLQLVDLWSREHLGRSAKAWPLLRQCFGPAGAPSS